MAGTAPSHKPTEIRARLITDADVAEVVNLLTRGFVTDRPRAFWNNFFACLGDRPVPAGFPRYGYVVESDGTFVGVLVMIFSTISEGGKQKIRCNVSSWYVDPGFRSYASLLASQVFKFKNVTVLIVSAARHTHPMVEVRGFARCSNGIFMAVPALSRRFEVGQVRVIDAQNQPDAPFDPHERELMLEHAKYGCTSLWCVTPERAHPFVFRPRRIKVLLPCAQIVYCRNIDEFVRFARPIGLFLARSLQLAVMIDANGPIPGLVGRYYPDKMPKYVWGPDQPRLGDLAYTEASLFGV